MQKKNIGWESGQQKRASAKVPELKESLQLKWHDMEGKWPTDEYVPDFESYSKVCVLHSSYAQSTSWLHHQQSSAVSALHHVSALTAVLLRDSWQNYFCNTKPATLDSANCLCTHVCGCMGTDAELL